MFPNKASKILLIVGLLVSGVFFIIFFIQGQFDTFLDAAHMRFWVSTKLPSMEESPLHPLPDLKAFPASLDDLFIVAHYDDESLATGGFLASEVKAGKKVGVVVASFSQGQAPAQRNWYGLKHNYRFWRFKYIYGLKIRPKDRTDYALDREAETAKALDYLGVPKESRLYLRYPDLMLEQLITEPEKKFQGDFLDPVSKQVEKYSGNDWRQTILALLKQTQPKLVVTHFPDDTNSDHRTVGRVVEDVIHKQQLPITIWRFLVHWNNQDAAWAPEQYNTEAAWLLAEPVYLYQVPAGSPTTTITSRERIDWQWREPFWPWKQRLLDFYFSQLKFDTKLKQKYAKNNELFWDLEQQKLIEIVYYYHNTVKF